MSARIEALRAAGAETFDGPGFRFVCGLFARAAALDGNAAAQLRQRAEARLDRLEAALTAARADAERTLGALIEAGADARAYVALFEAGDFKTLQREAPAALRAARRDRDAYAERALRLAREAEARGLALPAEDQTRIATLQGQGEDEPERAVDADRALGDRLARALFRDTADHARGALVIARAAASVPAEAGPYNPQVLAVQALELAETLSPAYLRAYLRDLEALAVLRNLPEPTRRRKRR